MRPFSHITHVWLSPELTGTSNVCSVDSQSGAEGFPLLVTCTVLTTVDEVPFKTSQS